MQTKNILKYFFLYLLLVFKNKLFILYFREKGTLNLQKSDLELNVLCPEDCNQYQRTKIYQFTYDIDANDTNDNNQNEYVKLEHDNDFNDYFTQCRYQNVKNNDEIESNYHCKSKASEAVNDFDYDNDGIRDSINENNDVNTDVINDNDDGYQDSEEENDENNTPFNDFNENNETKIDKNVDNETVTEQKLYNEENEVNDITQTVELNDEIMEIDENNETNDDMNVSKKKKVKKTKKKGFKKIILSLEEQKAQLEANRKEKKYLESEFKCYNCAIGFLFKDTYQAHMMRHEEVQY